MRDEKEQSKAYNKLEKTGECKEGGKDWHPDKFVSADRTKMLKGQ